MFASRNVPIFLWFLASRTVSSVVLKPCRTAGPSFIALALSGTNRNIGMTNTMNQIAVSGPMKRSPSRAVASNPKAGGVPISVNPVFGLVESNKSAKASDTSPPR